MPPIYNKKIKRKTEDQAIFRHLFAHLANGSLSFVRFLTKKQMEVFRVQMDWTD
jgi:hypothetical protein